MSRTQQQFRRSIPARHNAVRVLSLAAFEVRLGIERPCETKIGNAKIAVVGDKQVGRLHVSMKDVILRISKRRTMNAIKQTYTMHVLRTLQKLLHVQLDLTGLQLDMIVVQKTRQVMIHVGEDHSDRQWILVVT